MAWIVLVLAGLFEIVWAVALKQSDSFTKLWPSVIFIITACISFACLAFALRHLPMGTSYAVWTGIGAVGVAIVGVVWFGEPASIVRFACIALILIGIVGLKVSSGQSV